MTKVKLLTIFLLTLTLISCAQEDKYDLKKYIEVKRGNSEIGGVVWPYVIEYAYHDDTSYTAKLTYDDSLYKDLRTIFFFHKRVANGPFRSFIQGGRLYKEGFYEGGRKHGEEITYGENGIIRRQYYDNGHKTGVWKEYDNKGKLIRETRYDDKKSI